jgi:hypothetical protein
LIVRRICGPAGLPPQRMPVEGLGLERTAIPFVRRGRGAGFNFVA